jgi:A/G-specific adenine glycosylase
VGPYTAAAISSFAFGLPYAVVDGNVFRVLARIFGIASAIDTSAGKKEFTTLATSLLDKSRPGEYNQAIMDFGATVCKPVAPGCSDCIFKRHCVANRKSIVNELPVKQKKSPITTRWFYYLLLEYRDQWIIRQRTEKDIWQLLYEFPLIETNREKTTAFILKEAIAQNIVQPRDCGSSQTTVLLKQQLSHRLIKGRFIRIKMKSKPAMKKDWMLIPKNEIGSYGLPRFIRTQIPDLL